MKKWFLTTILSMAILLSSIAGINISAVAAETDVKTATTGKEYVSLPITIRDYAADGMLFEWNELNQNKEQVTIDGKKYNHGNTAGYSLLQTNDKDISNKLSGNNTISGTTLIQNGTWNATSVTSKTQTLSSGAVQNLYGCLVRTDLVEDSLGTDGKPVYRKETVKFLAKYMKTTLANGWEENGAYNLYYVMGTKLYDDNNEYVGNNSNATRDLAEVFRQSITEGLGTYTETKAKILTKASDCKTYYDAAYFLLQSLYSDNDGYGQTVSEYHQINLVKKGNAYVFNSAYDNVVYDQEDGVIYNSQTDTITARKNASGNTAYVRGNIQPENRFDPIKDSYYGKNGNAYQKIFSANSSEMTNYYNSTNYNMTLEGHAQFIYYEDDELYFNFTGDDDVYLYINGVRVLDMGGAHAISKCGISLNQVKELCGLKDGQMYSFDFFYMERHGTAANFGIETNIKIVDPSMATEKHAYQNGSEVGNYGYVDENKPVRYMFNLTNNGDAKIEELTFSDFSIGVNLSKDIIHLNDETKLETMSLDVKAADGTVKVVYHEGELTEEKLKGVLENGLEIGDTIRIFGFTAQITQWNNDQYVNTVYTSAVSKGENASQKTLNGIATCTVQKADYVYPGIHYYEWMGKGVAAERADLESAIKEVVKNPELTDKDVQICSSSGKTGDSAEINENAKVTEEGNIVYTGTKTGMDTYYYKIGNYGPVAVTVYSYDTADNVYVLDYCLPVELNGEDFGFLVNDTLTLRENPYQTTSSIQKVSDSTKNYGKFTYGTEEDSTSLKYTMNKIMNGEDCINVTIQILEEGATEVTAKTGVVMTETVKVVPANVVYYEDDFPGITYISSEENGWAHYKTEDSEGNEQSADQDSPYGSDPNYQTDKETTYVEYNLDMSDMNTYQQEVIRMLNDKLGLSGGDSSNGTISRLEVEKTADVLSFEFHGTGFEIISRTTEEEYAVVSVRVERMDEDGTITVVKQYPVITECKGGTLYQVPIISVTGLSRADYKVTLTAAGSTPNKTRVLYIDGIRIYEPLDEFESAEYYNPDEVHAKFYEIKSLIGDGKAVYAEFDENKYCFVAGSTLIEDADGDILLSGAENVEEYLNLGPNNELYLDGTIGSTFLQCYLIPEEDIAENARTVQVGAHRKADYIWDGTDGVKLIYGSTVEDLTEQKNYFTVESATEQYYELDVTKLTKDENNRYLLFIGINDVEGGYAALSLTNLKLSGYTLAIVNTEIQAAVSANAFENSPALTELLRLKEYYGIGKIETTEQPAVNENLTITSAALKASKLASGKKATVCVKTGTEAEKLVVLDASGNEVVFEKVSSNTKNSVVTYQAAWTVTGKSGEQQVYTVMVYDAEGLRSANTMQITITIK